ncbi:Ubiquitin carboxyl-terminal hydrolase [Eumeta japonica]|uniref:Ubiquitin carboxyl-terminal hydrolase n=1 Tax=Eumeta variegata TaxID=151549 RepID=A0A4C1W4K5_EUMVA|nr:Ubiquitin carboxyl-terminal hydrolase [Eumeta japonica]
MAVRIPMESNPDTINKYLQKLGVSSKWRVVDVLGLEGEPLAWVPRPVMAVILLFPISESYEQNRLKQEKNAEVRGREISKNVFHLRQIASTVCGTVALVHSVANNAHEIELSDGPLKSYLKSAEKLDSEGKGMLLENSQALFDAYNEIVQEHQNQDNEEVTVSNHFVTFVHKDGSLYELDGRKQFPVRHGPTGPETLLEDAARVCRQFVERDPDNVAFTAVALVAAP